MFICNKDAFLQFIKPRKTPKSSPFWASFYQILYQKIKQDLIRCDRSHVIRIHRSIDGLKAVSSYRNACKASSVTDRSQQKVDSYLFSTNSSTNRIATKIKRATTDACAEFSAIDNRAFATVNGNGFINLIETVFNTGQRLSKFANVKITDLLPDATTVNELNESTSQLQITFCN